MSSKKAVIEVELGYESTHASNEQIVRDIRKEALIPWCSRICKVEVKGSQ